jgi:hypothetical protein
MASSAKPNTESGEVAIFMEGLCNRLHDLSPKSRKVK